jgi:hypothetical protein
MKMIDKIILESLMFMALFAVYMIYGDKPFLFKNFWRTYFYVLMYGFQLALIITALPLAEGGFSILVLWTIILFLTELIIYNVLLINKPLAVYQGLCNNKTYGLVFSISIAGMLLVSLLIKIFK